MAVEFGDYSINSWPIAVLLLGGILFFMHRSGKYSRWYLVCVLLFGVYVLYVISQVFFPIAVSGAFADAARQSPLGGSYSPRFNLIPLSFGPYPDPYRVVLTSSLNGHPTMHEQPVLMIPEQEKALDLPFLSTFRLSDTAGTFSIPQRQAIPLGIRAFLYDCTSIPL